MNRTAREDLHTRVSGVCILLDDCANALFESSITTSALGFSVAYDASQQSCLGGYLSSVTETQKTRFRMFEIKRFTKKMKAALNILQREADSMRYDVVINEKKIRELRFERLPYNNWPVSAAQITDCIPHAAKLLEKEDLLSKLTSSSNLVVLTADEYANVTSTTSYKARAERIFHILSHRQRPSFDQFCDVVRVLKGGRELYQRLKGSKRKERKSLATLFADPRFAKRRIKKIDLEFDEEGDEDFIDSGGFSEVYKAVYNEKIVALKVFIKERRRNDEEEKLLGKEAKVLLCITSHPNILSLVGICCEKKFFALVLEYVDGKNLHERLTQKDHGQMEDWQNRCDVAQQIARGMSHLHNSDPTVIHLDLKPKNVLIKEVREGSRVKLLCKICDFGLAKVKGVSSLTKRHSEERIPSGTPSYIAPERYKKIPYGVDDSEKKLETAKKADVYSFGVILWQIREMERPFDETRAAIHRHNRECPGMPKARAEAPKWFVTMTDLCTRCDPMERPSFLSLSKDFFETFLQYPPEDWVWHKS